MSNSTQNDEIGKMERAINEGFAESERDLMDKKTPLDQPTQNDWEDEIKDMLCDAGLKPIHFKLNNSGVRIINRIKKELADARRELIDEIDLLLAMTESTTEETTHEEMLRIVGNIRKDLATLGKEESNG